MPTNRSLENLPPTDKQGFPWTAPNIRVPRLTGDLPRITIVTPSYNQGKFLEETLRSILLQGYPNLEYIVIDGGSTDNTREILERYAPFLDVWVSEPDNGQAHAINKGLERSTGDIMGWVNSDDMLLPGALFRIAEAFRKPSVTVVTGFREVRNRNSEFVSYWIRDIPSAYYLTKYCCIAQETTFWRRSVWEQMGSLDESMHYALDYEYWLRMVRAGHQFKLLPYYIGAFRSYDENKTSTLYQTYQRDMQEIYQRYQLAISEQDIFNQLGHDWATKYALINRMCETPILQYPRLTIGLLYLMQQPLIKKSVTHIYRRLQRRHHTLSQPNGEPAMLQPLSQLTQAHHFGVRSVTLLDEMVLNQHEELPLDGIILGQGWYNLETDINGETFCWASRETQLIVTLPTERQPQLRLRVTAGPSIPTRQFVLRAYDTQGNYLAEQSVHGQGVIHLQLHLRPGNSQLLILRVEETNIQPTAEDARTDLCFRLVEIGWSHEIYYKPENVYKRTEAYDIVATNHIPYVAQTALPVNGLFIGDGWYPLENHHNQLFRWAHNDAQIIVTRPQYTTIQFVLEPGYYEQVPHLTVSDSAGRILASITPTRLQIFHVVLVDTKSDIKVLRLRINSNAQRHVTDSRQLNFRVFAVNWLPTRRDFQSRDMLNQLSTTIRTATPYERLATLPIIGTILRGFLWLRHLGHAWAAESILLNQMTKRVMTLENWIEGRERPL